MNHFTIEQRYKLEVLLQQNVRKAEIAIDLGKDPSSIYREIKRNSDVRSSVYIKRVLGEHSLPIPKKSSPTK